MLERASELLEWTMVEPPRNEGTEWQLRQQDADDRARNVWRGVVGELATRIEGGSSDIVPGRYSRRREDGGRNKETTKDAIRNDTQINMRTDHVTVPYQATSTIAATNHYNRPPYEEDSNLNEDNEDKEDLDDTPFSRRYGRLAVIWAFSWELAAGIQPVSTWNQEPLQMVRMWLLQVESTCGHFGGVATDINQYLLVNNYVAQWNSNAYSPMVFFFQTAASELMSDAGCHR
ncbi:hypothetical protein K438DRAFT_1926805 [Mycena galopus ATCC 62051]|nr:hypothetical protein K438DRAFT_1926805 [Mycena galopus ATCC 62051]